jgi:hypothetical protein
MKKSFPMSQVYDLLEPGPVVLVTTTQKDRANIPELQVVDLKALVPNFDLLFRPRLAPPLSKHVSVGL